MEARLAVTLLALVEVRRSGELLIMRILMTVGAQCELDLEDCVATRRYVAFRASRGGVLLTQREPGLAVISDGELRRLKAVDRVARFALAPIGALYELPEVRIGFVAIGTGLECNLSLEVRFAMARLATKFHVLAKKRILRL